MSKRSRYALPGVGLAVTMVAVAGCGGPVGGGSGGADGTVTTVINGDPSGFNPLMYRTTNDGVFETLLYDSLLRLDDDNTLVPGLAASWEVESASSYTFTLRDGATCSDGTPITGEVVADSLTALAAPETASAARFLIFGSGDATITADENVVSVELSEPFSDLPQGLTLPQSGVICPAGLEDPEALNTGPVDGAYSGPYVLASTNPGVGYELTLRDDYDQWPEYETELAGEAPSTVNITVSSDPSTVANRLISGDVDLGGISNDNIARFEDNPDVTVQQAVANWVFIVFNQREGSPFHENPELRTAVAQAVSRQSFSNAISNGRASLLAGVGDETGQCVLSDESLLVPNDTDAAATELAGAALKMIGYTSLGTNGSAGVAVQEAISAAGADVDLTTTDTADWATTVTQQTAQWDLTVMGGLTPLLQSLTRIMGTPAEDGGRSISGASLPEAEQALEEALSADTEEAKCAAFEEAQRLLLEDVTAVPLVSLPENVVTREGVTVRVFNGTVDYKTLRVSE